MTDKEKDLEDAIDLLIVADQIMSNLYAAIINYNRSTFWGKFGRIFLPLKDRIAKWQDELWATNFIGPSPSASPSEPEEAEVG